MLRTVLLSFAITANPVFAQDGLAELAEILAPGSGVSLAKKLQAIETCGSVYAESEGGLVTSLLFRCASLSFEPRPAVRCAAA